MAVTPYKPISWGDNEPIFTQKLQQMANNDQWLFENGARWSYNAYGFMRGAGIKLACGLVLFPAAKSIAQVKTVYFSNFFSTGCRPIIATSLLFGKSIFIHHGIYGIGERFPDHRGFTISARMQTGNAKTDYFDTSCYIQWIAMGY